MIKKINTIKNMAVFQDYSWDSSLEKFMHINIIYGQNYSGKTTLSRIIRALETGNISDKYYLPQFSLNFSDGNDLTQNNLKNHNHTIRVFNEDFVKDNLSFIRDDEEGTINPFAILGEDNKKIEDEIKRIESALGSEEEKTNLRGKLAEASGNFSLANYDWNKQNTELENQLREKANNTTTGIKHNKIFGNANYDIRKIKDDIAVIVSDTYTPIDQNQITKHQELLKEQSKGEVQQLDVFNLSYSSLQETTKDIVTKKIQVSAPIQELLSDAALNNWVREGLTLHQEKRDTCAFCGSAIPDDLMDKLDKHFNEESENLICEIDRVIILINDEIAKIPKLFKVVLRNYYSEFQPEIEKQRQVFNEKSMLYIETLQDLITQLEKRKKDIFTPLKFNDPISVEPDLLNIYNKYEDLRNKSNNFTNELSNKQSQARKTLRLNEVYSFITDIKYVEKLKAIEISKINRDKLQKEKEDAQKVVTEKEEQIKNLKIQLKDESKGADKVNDYLNNFFGHQFLTLEAIENTEAEATNKYRFEITRNGTKAFHLSEGECRLIAFCYFMAKLDDVDTKGKSPIIWIDDPISSLDANHVFFIYSLINSQILKTNNFKQLFISTHNLEFLKFLKRFTGKFTDTNGNIKDYQKQYYILKRQYEISIIEPMPKYMKTYITEFNYLFGQIYECANIKNPDDSNYGVFYNFGNNARKFLEIYLYYKYPNNQDDYEKMLKFFGQRKIPAILMNRMNNEYSHLYGTFERGALPVIVAEMKKAAEFILDRLKEDEDQYHALLESVGMRFK